MKAAVTITLISSLLILNKATAQGCSDAGFCTIGHLDQLKTGDEAGTHQKFTILAALGVGDENVFVFAPGVQYDNQFTKEWAVQAKLTGNIANGNLGSAAGLGDLFLSGIYTLPQRRRWEFSFTAGAKIPLSDGNLKENGKSLPMQYQSSLGTLDLITELR